MEINNNVLSNAEKITFALRSLYYNNGYTPYKMSKFEEYDLYARNKDFLVSDNVITFTDTSGKLLALKPDVTLSIIKNLKDSPEEVHKLYYDENVYRISKGSNSFKEILQAGVECIGNINSDLLSDTLILAAKSLNTIDENFILDISDLDILSSIITKATENSDTRISLIKCIGEKNIFELEKICEENNISNECTIALKKLITLYGNPTSVISELETIGSSIGISDIANNLKSAISNFKHTDFSEKIRIDFSVVSDMNYYNGIVFKGFIADIPESVLSGGQYDKLMKKMKHKSKAVGFAVYIDLLMDKLF